MIIEKEVIKLQFDVSNKNLMKRLIRANETGKFKEYPKYLMDNTCIVKVNKDDYLLEDEFMISSDDYILPRCIRIYGKKHKAGTNDQDNIYFNYWIETFTKTIQNGNICKNNFNKSMATDLAIGLTMTFRMDSFHYSNWNREKIIKFLTCLFGTNIKESNYYQPNVLELMVA